MVAIASQETFHQSSANPRLKILFFTASMGGGGAEMHLLRVINHLDRSQFQISLALARAGGTYEAFLAEDVTLHHLNTGKTASSTLRMIRAISPLRRVIEQERPDIVCSVMGHANMVAVLATRGLAQPPKLVLSVQNPPSSEAEEAAINRVFLTLMPHLYSKADSIIALSRGVAKDITDRAASLGDRISVIYNAGLDERVLQGAIEPLAEDVPRPLIVACGRLTEQKAFPDLLQAMAQVRKVVPAHLWIVGEGKLRPALEQQIRELELTDAVRLVGFQSNPYQYMAAADVFALSSIYEGFGNVIVEAMATGTAVVATDCPSGPGEIIQSETNGLLVPPRDPNALAQALVRVLLDADLKHNLAAAGKRRSQDFNSQSIADAYGQLFSQIVGSSTCK